MPNAIGHTASGISNRSIYINLTKYKKLKLTKSKKLGLTKAKKADFVSVNFFEIRFFTPKTKKVFIYLQEIVIKALNLKYFNLKYHIKFETNVWGYAIRGILDQIVSNQYFSNYMIYKNLIFSQFEYV